MAGIVDRCCVISRGT